MSGCESEVRGRGRKERGRREGTKEGRREGEGEQRDGGTERKREIGRKARAPMQKGYIHTQVIKGLGVRRHTHNGNNRGIFTAHMLRYVKNTHPRDPHTNSVTQT